MRSHSWCICVAIIIALGGCGRRPKNFLSFQEPPQEEQCPRFAFGAPKSLSYMFYEGLPRLSWDPIADTHLVGYNVYRFTSRSFIPKHSCNGKPLTLCEFLDTDPLKHWTPLYVVRGVFSKDGQQFEGPTSAPLRIQKKQ